MHIAVIPFLRGPSIFPAFSKFFNLFGRGRVPVFLPWRYESVSPFLCLLVYVTPDFSRTILEISEVLQWSLPNNSVRISSSVLPSIDPGLPGGGC